MAKIKVGQYYKRYLGGIIVQVIGIEDDSIIIKYTINNHSHGKFSLDLFNELYPKLLPCYGSPLWKTLYD
jgi:hypothetical protein